MTTPDDAATPRTPRVELSTVEVAFSQEGDSAGGPDYQLLTVKAEDAGAGHFLIVQTERWALDISEIDAFAGLLRRVAKMAEGDGPRGEDG